MIRRGDGPNGPWEVRGNIFIGLLLVDLPVVENTGPARASVKRMVASALPYCRDLTTVGALKQCSIDPDTPNPQGYSFKDFTVLEAPDGTFLGTVNAPFDELSVHWCEIATITTIATAP